jgi:hypothetical protein
VSNQPLINYLDDEYLVSPHGYLAGTFGGFIGMQVQMRIDTQENVGMQSELRIDAAELTGMQVEARVDTETLTGMQAEQRIVQRTPTGMQSEMQVDIKNQPGLQTELVITGSERLGMQVKAQVVDDDDTTIGMQADMKVVDKESRYGMQAKIFPLAHWLHPKYLVEEEGYLEYSYLAEKMCAFQGMQVLAKIISAADDRYEGMQVDMRIDTADRVGMQTLMRVFEEKNTGMQIRAVRSFRLGAQANFVIYNTTQLRLLCAFPSRGIAKKYGPGATSLDNANWTTPQSMASGDLGKLQNLNTDVLEERIQSANGVTFLELRCDTGAGNTFVDTLAILEHNITTSATITVQGSDNHDFSSVKFQFVVNPTSPYAIYIAPELPTVAARYYRLLISDNTNPDNHIRIGTVVFGSAEIFSVKECFENPVTFGRRHFKDEIEVEGFTSTSNDRATRRFLGLRFSRLDVEGGNYNLLQEYFDFAKTDLKCLVVPTPTKPTVLTVFSKLVQLPSEQHEAIDVREDALNVHFASIDLEWDESN